MMVPFGLTSAPMAFMNPMNKSFELHLDMFVVFIHNILIYYKGRDQHITHLQTVL